MSVFTPQPDLSSLFSEATPRSYGVALAPTDAHGLQVSAQIGVRNTGQAVWDNTYVAAGWDGGKWDDANFMTWVDVTSRARGMEWTRGTSDPISEPEVGTASITLDNRDGLVSPWATSGPFAQPVDGSAVWDVSKWDVRVAGSNASLIRPNTPVRFGATDSGSNWLPFFTGFIETVTEDSSDNVDAWVTLGLVDVAATLAAIGSAQGNATSLLVAGNSWVLMSSGLLQDAGFTSSLSSTFIGSGSLNSAPLQVPDPMANRLAAAQTLMTSVNGFVIGGPDGFLYFVGGGVGGTIWSSQPFSNSPSGSNYPVVTMTPYSSTDRLLNSVSGTRIGGTEQTITDTDSIKQFGVQANALGWPRTDLLLQNDSDVLTLVTLVLNEQSQDFLGISSIDIDCDQNPAQLYYVMAVFSAQALENQYQLIVNWKHPSSAVFAATLSIIGFTHSITMEGSQAKWTATLKTAKAS